MELKVTFLLCSTDHLFCRLILYIPFDIVGQVERIDASLLLGSLDAWRRRVEAMPNSPEPNPTAPPVAHPLTLYFIRTAEGNRYYEIVHQCR